MLKRVIRLEPPYLIALALTVSLLYASAAAPGFDGPPPDVTPARVLLHLGYLNVFFDRDWFNPVFWTLAVEFQFYLSMIVLFPLLSHAWPARRLAGLAIMVGLALAIRDRGLLFPYLGLFASGAVAFQYRAGLIGRRTFLVLALTLAAVNVQALGPAEAAAGLFASSAAAFLNPPRLPALAALGAISYSLYLLHVPIGGRVMNLAGRLPDVFHGPALIVAVTVSLAAALVLYAFVERPAQRLSGRISYADRARRRAGAAEVPA